MFLLVTFLVIAAAAAVIFFAVRRQTRPELTNSNNYNYLDGENLRPLFAPDMEEIGREERRKEDAEKLETDRIDREKKLASFEEFRQTWRESPDRKNTIELLARAADTGSGEMFLGVVDEILHRRNAHFSNADIAELIESHFWLLPREERTPGVTFSINRELAALRGRSGATSDEEASGA